MEAGLHSIEPSIPGMNSECFNGQGRFMVARMASAFYQGTLACPPSTQDGGHRKTRRARPGSATSGTPDTSQNDNGQDVTARAWLLHFADRDPLEVWRSP